jgi:hypothetical protein
MPCGSKSLFAGTSHLRAVMWWLVNGAYGSCGQQLGDIVIRPSLFLFITVSCFDLKCFTLDTLKTRICESFSPAFETPQPNGEVHCQLNAMV